MTSERDELPIGDIEALLPWHAAGTLDPRDARRVEAALAADPELARRYRMVQDEIGETVLLNETLGAPSPRAMEKLFARIDAEPKRVASFSPGNWLMNFVAGFSPRTLAYAGAAAMVAILLQAAVITGIVLDRPNGSAGYVTASAPGEADGTFVMVQFAPQASAADISAALTANQARIVDGPNAAGMFRLRIAQKALPKDDLAAAVRRLQENKAIGFVATVN